MKRALEISVPHRMPHVSRLRSVFGCARLRNDRRSSGGSITVRRDSPASVRAVGLKIVLAGSTRCGGGGEGVAVEGEEASEPVPLRGLGGALRLSLESESSGSSFDGITGGVAALTDLWSGRSGGIFQSIASSLLGTVGYW